MRQSSESLLSLRRDLPVAFTACVAVRRRRLAAEQSSTTEDDAYIVEGRHSRSKSRRSSSRKKYEVRTHSTPEKALDLSA